MQEDEYPKMHRLVGYWNKPVEVVYEAGGRNFVAFVKAVDNAILHDGSEAENLYKALDRLSNGAIFNGMQKLTPAKYVNLTGGPYLILDLENRIATIKTVWCRYEKYEAGNAQYIARLDTSTEHTRRLSFVFSALKELVGGRLEKATYYVSGGVFRITDHDIEYTSTVWGEKRDVLPGRLYTLVDMLTETSGRGMVSHSQH